jgi:hypothetical protein
MEEFPFIANELFTKYYFDFNGKSYSIIEIEFYLHNPEHPDPYVHCLPEQLLPGYVYFHRTGINGKFRGGTFKGMDLTLGNLIDSHCGILIRTIYCLNTGNVVEGPCKVVNTLLEDFCCSSIEEFLGAYPNAYSTIVRNYPIPIKVDMLYGKRIGLGKLDEVYRERKYRFVANYELVHKQRTSLERIAVPRKTVIITLGNY